MSNRFTVPDISDFSPPSTPDRSSRIGGRQWFGDEPSTTPAGPPPSSVASFTPAGAPTVSFLGSSIMRGVTGPKQPSFVQSNTGNASKNLFPRDSARTPKGLFAAKESTASNLFANSSNPPLGRSIEPLNSRRPSNLSKQFFASEGEEEDDEMQREMDNAQKKPGTFALPYSDEETEHEETRTEEEEEEPGLELEEDLMEEDDQDFLPNLPPVPGVDEAFADNEDDLIQATFHANERVLHEAENLYRMSSRIPGLNVHREFMFARTAKEMHDETDPATLRENDDLILKTEELVSRIYDEGVGTTDDAEKLDLALAHASSQLCRVWQEHLHSINGQITERTGAIGPGAEADPFQKACWLGGLALHIHHMRVTDGCGEQVVPSLPEIMVDWMMRDHNVFSSAQLQEIGRCRPSPACHTLFWPSIINAIARGNLITSLQLLNDAGFDNVRTAGTRGDYMYTGQALQNLHHAVQITVDMLKSCPGLSNNWHVFGGEWTLFRHKAKNAREQLVRFAEGIDRARNLAGSHFEEPDNTMTYRAREAEGKVPWDVYKQLQTIFDITLGKANAILEASEDWVEASVALLVWLDEGRETGNIGLGQSVGMSKSVQPASPGASSEAYSERLAQCFHVAVDEFPVNTMDVDEITYTCAFEANWEGVVAGLRMWSLPVACAVAEIASLGGWLPRPEPRLIAMESMDQEVMEVLGMESKGPDEVEGLKDVTIVDYAKELAGIKHMQATVDGQQVVREGWELAVEVLGRMDSRAKSEDMVRQLLQNVLQDITLDSGATIDKVWVLMNQLGMLNFAEEAVESYADLLAQESHRYGEALWYYALGHRINKVREVLNLLMSYSLIQSTAFPPASDLDDHLDRLLTKRNATLEQLAKVDLEAAELLGKMLAGYATLRKFYDLRDNTPGALAIPDLSVFPFSQAQRAPSRRQQAAAALVAVIASSDDNIRGGLYDSTRDAVVSEDFLLALLGEALVFLKPQSSGARPASDDDTDEPDLTLEQLDVLFKAVEDIETVGSRVYAAADEFFQLVLASAPGLLKGSNPLDLMKKSTSGLSGTSSYVMSGSSMLASQLHRSFSGGSASLGKAGVTNTKRGWDWRQGMLAHTGAKDVLRMLRLGLSREVARLWLVQADGVII